MSRMSHDGHVRGIIVTRAEGNGCELGGVASGVSEPGSITRIRLCRLHHDRATRCSSHPGILLEGAAVLSCAGGDSSDWADGAQAAVAARIIRYEDPLLDLHGIVSASPCSRLTHVELSGR